MTSVTGERRAFSVSVFAVNDGAVLLVHHNRLNAWLPVGGEVEANETPLEAAKRELMEETGLTGDFTVPGATPVPGAPPGLLGYEEHLAGSKGRHLNFVFAARVPSRAVKGDGSFRNPRWVTEAPADAPVNVQAAVRLALDAARQ